MASGAIKCSVWFFVCISSTFAAKCHGWLLMWLHRAEMKVRLRAGAGHLGL